MAPSPMAQLQDALAQGRLIPYLGAGMHKLAPECPVPDSQEQLAAFITAKVAVPHKIKNRLTAAAPFIENFKHRQTLVKLMNEAFSPSVVPSVLHHGLAALTQLPLVVGVWYDDAMQQALAQRPNWCQVRGLSQAEHFGSGNRCYTARGSVMDEADVNKYATLLYKPLRGRAPADNYLISDSDYVELLTEIDI